MRQLPWIMLFGLLVVACQKNDDQPAVLDVSKGPKEFKGRPAQDPVVKVSGQSILYVKQNEKTRVLIQWRSESAGQVTVPLRAIDDGSGPLFVGEKPIEQKSKEEQYGAWECDCPGLCTECMGAAYTCCAIINPDKPTE